MSPHLISILLLLVAITSIQAGASLAKSLFPLVGAPGATALRLTFAALMLIGFWRPWRARLRPQELRNVLIYGVSLGLMNLWFYLALERLPLGITVALEFTGPLSVTLFSSRKPLDFLWASLAAIGILLLLPVSPLGTRLDPIGVAYALGAGACWGIYIVFGQRSGATIHGGVATSLGMGTAALVAVPVGVARAGNRLFNFSLIPVALAVAFLSSALPYSLEMVALKRLPRKTFGILMSLEPAVAAILGLLFLSEHLGATQWMAIACVVVASLGSVT